MRLKGRNNIFAGQTLNLHLFKGETAKDRVKCLVNPDWAASPDSLSLSKQIKGLEIGLIGKKKREGGKGYPCSLPCIWTSFLHHHMSLFLVSCLCCFISCIKQPQSSQSHSWKWHPAVSRSLLEFCEEHFKESFSGLQRFGISDSSWRRHLKAVKCWSASAGYPPTSVPLGPSSYFSATLLFVQHLPNIMTRCYHVSAFWRDWWKGMWVKTPSGWGHMTNGTERSCNKGRKPWPHHLLSKASYHRSDVHTYSSVW